MEGRQTAVEKVVEGVGPILTSTNEKHFEHRIHDAFQPQIRQRIARSVSGFKSTMAIMMERLFMSYEAVVRAQLGHLQEGCFGCSTLSTGTVEFLSIAWLSFPPNQEVLFAWASPSDDLGDLQQKERCLPGLRLRSLGYTMSNR